MPPLTLFEHQSLPYTALAPSSLAAIESLNQAAGIPLLQLGRTHLTATQYVGVVQLPDQTLEILPKIDHDPHADPDAPPSSPTHRRAADSAARNLLHLLAYTHSLQLHHEDIAQLHAHEASWLELLTHLFASDLHRLARRGLARSYVQVEDSLPLVRGRWLTARQLSRRPHILHEFDLQYDEFSPDHALNRIFRYTVETLLPITRSERNRSLLLDLRAWFDEVALTARPSPEQLDAVRFTRLNEPYRPAFNLARLFIENSISQLSAGKVQAFAFLFDMNVLFERFVAAFLQRHREAIFEDLPTPTIRAQSHGRTRHLAQGVPDGEQRVRLKPDVLLEQRAGRPLLILDTKYKRLDRSRRNRGLAEADLYQMLAYSTAYECPQTLLLYPESDGQSAFFQHRFTNTDFTNTAATINLHQDLSSPTALIERFRWLMRRTMKPSMHLNKLTTESTEIRK